MATVFERACDIILESEGGYTNVAADPGNWTGGACGVGRCLGSNFGISAAAYPDVDISGLTRETARAIYRRDYWEHIQGDTLRPALALMVFDAAVMSGVYEAVRWLQMMLEVTQDGRIGPATLAAVESATQSMGGAAVCAEYLAVRIWVISRLPTWKTFGLGWSRRVTRLPFQTLDLVQG